MSDATNAEFWAATPEIAAESIALSDALRRFLDRVAALTPDAARTATLVDALDDWSERLDAAGGGERESVWRRGPRSRPPALLPALDYREDGTTLVGHVTFGRFHIGRAGAHGGAIALVFDETMGALAGSGDGARARTAYLHVDYRAVTPIDTPLALRAWFEARDGRKRFLRATIADGERVCAEASGLWVELRPGQA